MTDDIEKYKNWRAITESDYVTMFIKTWFAFVATLRKLYPKNDLTEIIGKGDKVFLNPYLENFHNSFCFYNDFEQIKEHISKVYKKGRIFVLENPKYNKFFVEDFYSINKTFNCKKETDDYECRIKYTNKNEICFESKYLNPDFLMGNKHLFISEKIDISDLVKSEKLSDKQRQNYIEDESLFLEDVINQLSEFVSREFFSKVEKIKKEFKFNKKVENALESTSLLINEEYRKIFSAMKSSNEIKDNIFFTQLPCANFIHKIENNERVDEIGTYKWFLNFVYFLRNALFHEIIDPLDTFWQEVFKSSYMVLKEILDGNIKYFLDKEKILELLRQHIWNEFQNKTDLYLSNFNENVNDDTLDMELIVYSVDVSSIKGKSRIIKEYWTNDDKLVKRESICSFEYNRETGQIDKFKMSLIKESQVE